MEPMGSGVLPMSDKPIRVLFVCLGNICRSPAAEGIFRDLVHKEHLDDKILVASCGLGDWHQGQLPDPRMRQSASKRGLALTSRAKPFVQSFLTDYDYILASDGEVLHFLHQHAKKPEEKAKISLMTHFSKLHKGENIPDPYFGVDNGFELVLDILEESCRGLLAEIKSKLCNSK